MPDDNKQTPPPEQERTIEERVLLPITEGDMFPGEQQLRAEIESLEYDVRILRRLHGDNIPEDRNHMHACLREDEKMLILGPDIQERVDECDVRIAQIEAWKEYQVDHGLVSPDSYYPPPHDRERAPGNEPDIERLAEVAHQEYKSHYPKRQLVWWNQESEIEHNHWRAVIRAILKELGYQGEGAALQITHRGDDYWLSGPGFAVNLEVNRRGPIVADAIHLASIESDPGTPPDDKERTPGIELESPGEKR